MLLVDYPSIGGRYFPGYAKNSTRDLLNAYIYAHSQILIDEYPGYRVQAITRLQSQCANITFSVKSDIIGSFRK